MLGKLAIAALIPGLLFAQEAVSPSFRIADLAACKGIENEDKFSATLAGRIVARTDLCKILDDGSGRILIYCNDSEVPFSAGDRVQLTCTVWKNQENDHFLAGCVSDSRLLSRGPEPIPLDSDASEIVAEKHALQLVRTRGIVTHVFRDEGDPLWLDFVIETPRSHFIAVLYDRNTTPIETARLLIDREVVLTGIANSFIGISIPQAIDLPNLVLRSLGDIRIAEDPAFDADKCPHRQVVTGTVVSPCGENAIFLAPSDDGKHLKVRLFDGEAPVVPGEIVSVAGFVHQNAFLFWLDNAVVRTRHGFLKDGRPPTDVTVGDIISADDSGNISFDKTCQGTLVRISGTVSDTSLSANAEAVTYLDSDGFRIPVHLGDIPPPSVGSKVAVTGGCLITSETDDGPVRFCRFKGFEIFPRGAADIRILEHPPWWTPLRLGIVILGLFLAMIGIFIWNRLLKRVIERQSHQLFRTRLARERSNLRTRERTLLAIELHDALSQNLTGVGLQLSASKRARTVDPEAADQHVAAALRILKSSRVELDRCIRDLRSNALDNPNFADAIRQTLEPALTTADLALRFNVSRDQLDERTAHAVLSIIRELVSNAISHGRATQIRVAGEISTGQLKFAVSDNGTGFPAGEIPGVADGHFGLAGIRERIKDMNGTMEISTPRGHGTRIAITLPHPNAEQGEPPADEED